nr:hypothetical protein [Paraburkholderia tropica]
MLDFGHEFGDCPSLAFEERDPALANGGQQVVIRAKQFERQRADDLHDRRIRNAGALLVGFTGGIAKGAASYIVEQRLDERRFSGSRAAGDEYQLGFSGLDHTRERPVEVGFLRGAAKEHARHAEQAR